MIHYNKSLIDKFHILSHSNISNNYLDKAHIQKKYFIQKILPNNYKTHPKNFYFILNKFHKNRNFDK
jgi:hypothetical protein